MTYHKMLLGVGLALTILTPLSGAQAQNVNFGDNLSQWANDGECDDPRFVGNGMADILLDEDIRHDANDCRQLFSKGRISMVPTPTKGGNINFGDNSSSWANDGECDDPRFGGPGTAATLLDEDLGRDANDCRTLLQQGQIFVLNDIGIDTFIPSNVHFGDNSSQWANDGECDDPRFEGQGMADILLDEDTAHDANDCRMLFDSAQISVVGQANITSTINFGDDSSQWAHDGECDDPRFSGAGAAAQPLNENIARDAADCRMLMLQGKLLFDGQDKTAPIPKGSAQINFGDNTSTWAHDDECDDPRFSGSGMANILLDEDIKHDAADCQYLYQSNQIDYIGGGSNSSSSPAALQGASVNGKYQNLIESYECPVDVISGDHGTFQDYGYWSGGTDCGVSGTHPAGYYVWYNERWYVWATVAGVGTKTGAIDLCPSTALGLTQSLTCQCTADAVTNSSRVWGTGIYTSDSNICRAAVHAGQISTNGGPVQIFPLGAQNSYQGSSRNGVTSNDWGSYGESFSF